MTGKTPRNDQTKTAAQKLGALGEQYAAAHLEAQGMEIVAQNWRCPQGEIDIIARDSSGDEPGEWVFVEVRTRRAPNTNSAIESISPAKQQRVAAAATAYLDTRDLAGVAWRFDLVAVALTPDGPQIEIIRDAFGW